MAFWPITTASLDALYGAQSESVGGRGGVKNLRFWQWCRQGASEMRKSNMGKIRRKFDLQFKIRVAEAVESGAAEVSALCREQQLSRTVVDRWVEKLREGTLGAKASRERELARQVEKLQSKVGELTMQIDLLKKVADWKRQQTNDDTLIITSRSLDRSQPRARALALPSPATTTGRKPAH